MVNYSVLMSVYYKENPKFLCSSIESMLNQSVRPYDFVLVCDGKLTRDLDKVIETYCQENRALFKIIRLEENKGLGNALNIGLQYCQCELIARCLLYTSLLGYHMYKQGQEFKGGEGIISKGVENTIHNIGRLSQEGMKETDKEIIRIMTDC